MIKNILITCTILLSWYSLGAQTCTPDTNLKVAGFLPASLPAGSEGVFYNEGISVLTFRDTYRMVGIAKIPVRMDSIKVTGIAGLPPGISYKCQHPRCVYLWDTVRCVSIYGTPTKAGTYPIKIYVRAFAKLGGTSNITQNDSISRFTMVVNGNTAGITSSANAAFSVYPVPAGDMVSIRGEKATEKIWQVRDMGGRILTVSQHAEGEEIRLNIASLSPGTYLVQSGNISLRFIKQR